MSTKNNPGAFDCYAKAEPDEPMFVLLARDPLAPIIVAEWIKRARRHGVPDEKLSEALLCAHHMINWRFEQSTKKPFNE